MDVGLLKITDDIILPTFSSQFKKVWITLALVTCLWSRKDPRQLKEVQVEAGKWLLRCRGPSVTSYLAFSSQNGQMRSSAPGGRYEAEAGL